MVSQSHSAKIISNQNTIKPATKTSKRDSNEIEKNAFNVRINTMSMKWHTIVFKIFFFRRKKLRVCKKVLGMKAKAKNTHNIITIFLDIS